MTLLANPLVNAAAFNHVECANIKSPGIFKLSGGGRRYKWDIKDCAAAQGQTETYQGWKVTEDIRGRFEFWLPEQIDEFYARFLPVLKYDALKQNPIEAIQIFHPALFANDISSVITLHVGPLVHDGLQLWVVEVEWAEYRPAPKNNATSTPTTTKANGDPTKVKPTAQSEQDRQIVELLRTAGFTGANGKPPSL